MDLDLKNYIISRGNLLHNYNNKNIEMLRKVHSTFITGVELALCETYMPTYSEWQGIPNTFQPSNKYNVYTQWSYQEIPL